MTRCPRCYGDLFDLSVFCPHCAQVHEPDFNQLINQVVGNRFRIYRRLGHGGLSTVFAATDSQNDQIVVIKVSDPAQLVRRELSYAIEVEEARRYWAEMLERMRREAETLALIHHPNIVSIYGTGMINDDLRYVAMEYLRGRTLRQELDLVRRLEVSEAIRIVIETASALSEIHARGIVHRDINPRNLMVADCGSRTADCESESAVKLIDFGIAKFPQPPGAPPFTQFSSMSGTVAYASPEQCQSRPVDHRTDIYSLGIMLYEMLTGERPFNGRTPTEIALKQIQAEPRPPRALNPDLSASLEKSVLHALKKDPIERPQSVEEFAGELRAGANQIVIPLHHVLEDEEETTSSNLILASEASVLFRSDQLLNDTGSRRRFTAVAAVSLFVIFTSAGLLLARHINGSRLDPSATQGDIAAITSSLPAATSSQIGDKGMASPLSDADALELAARGTQDSIPTASPSHHSQVQTQPVEVNTVHTRPPAMARSKGKEQKKAVVGRTDFPPPPSAEPKTPPSPSPVITANRVPPPTSEPDVAQAPRRRDENSVRKSESDESIENRRPPYDRPSTKGPRRNGDLEPNRRATVHSDRDDGSDDESDDDSDKDRKDRDKKDKDKRDADKKDAEWKDEDDEWDRIGPKLITWRGSVDEERVIKIEMPGIPGTIEIPRIYRSRVGVIEPPSHSNRWKCAVLRVFGRGSVSILVRWWPLARGSFKLTARR